ncbi:hypothetical protein CROQUDRAFT_664429 [Cronartium quercuum f. sp. fusiforme G11]|uniref:Uncharacterized protein n=1 Tax=Cronartium quercuum f. sp. fusiforme G11 TaxID=708437 RepID=A0A9P6N8J0_9BASI|nr:hypothetical protein CROQUDRAFT_664429 [Cronartium quercuum f. sp. fusiforme G11]
MTSIDPSHFPSLSLASGDPTGGKAVHQPTSPSAESCFSSCAHESQSAGRLFPLFAIPDLRYEQGYLMSLRPFFYLQRKAINFDSSQPRNQLTYDLPSTENIDNMFYLGRNFRVKWPLVIWVTLRDQMLYPMMQGCLWGTLSLVLAQILRARTFARSRSLPGDKPSGLWRRMLRKLLGGAKLNTL